MLAFALREIVEAEFGALVITQVVAGENPAALAGEEVELVHHRAQAGVVARLLGQRLHALEDALEVHPDRDLLPLFFALFLFLPALFLLLLHQPGGLRQGVLLRRVPAGEEGARGIFRQADQRQGAAVVIEKQGAVVVLVSVEVALGDTVEVTPLRVPGGAVGAEARVADAPRGAGLPVVEVQGGAVHRLVADVGEPAAVRRPGVLVELPLPLVDLHPPARGQVHEEEALGVVGVDRALAIRADLEAVLPAGLRVGLHHLRLSPGRVETHQLVLARGVGEEQQAAAGEKHRHLFAAAAGEGPLADQARRLHRQGEHLAAGGGEQAPAVRGEGPALQVGLGVDEFRPRDVQVARHPDIQFAHLAGGDVPGREVHPELEDDPPVPQLRPADIVLVEGRVAGEPGAVGEHRPQVFPPEAVADEVDPAVLVPHREALVAGEVERALELGHRGIADPDLLGVAAAVPVPGVEIEVVDEQRDPPAARLEGDARSAQVGEFLRVAALDVHRVERPGAGRHVSVARAEKHPAPVIPADHLVRVAVEGELTRLAPLRGDYEHVLVAVVLAAEGDPLAIRAEGGEALLPLVGGHPDGRAPGEGRGPQVPRGAEDDPAAVQVGIAQVAVQGGLIRAGGSGRRCE